MCLLARIVACNCRPAVAALTVPRSCSCWAELRHEASAVGGRALRRRCRALRAPKRSHVASPVDDAQSADGAACVVHTDRGWGRNGGPARAPRRGTCVGSRRVCRAADKKSDQQEAHGKGDCVDVPDGWTPAGPRKSGSPYNRLGLLRNVLKCQDRRNSQCSNPIAGKMARHEARE
jgi:hypothetical protein